tara:strand:+ start:525 stop:1331 length:807 start_codon:yes stop_codon:yes gene_type:complete
MIADARNTTAEFMNRAIKALNGLYNGSSTAATVFRFALLGLDALTILYFVMLSVMAWTGGWIVGVDMAIAVYLIADLVARGLIEKRPLVFLLKPATLTDLVVIVSLLATPFVQSFAFLRVLRTLRLLRSYHMARDLRARYRFFARRETVIQAVLNLFVFIYVVSALVLVLQSGVNPLINNYLDALYYTVATLTTTGFGDVVLTGTSGRLLAVLIMVAGVALFLRLLQTIFRPTQVSYKCPDCGLSEHDRDAIHCKHCGRMIRIETEGL